MFEKLKQRFRNPPTWQEAWQLPTLLLGLVLFGFGLVFAFEKPAPPDYTGALDTVSEYLLAYNLEEAEAKLETLKPVIVNAAQFEQARYHQYWGDALYLNVELIRSEGKYDSPENYQRIVQQYDQAQKLGATFNSGRLQHWAEALVALDRDQEALLKIREIEDSDARRRYAVIKQIIQRELDRHDGKPHQLMDLVKLFIDELRNERDPVRRRAEEVWAIGLQVEEMLLAGDAGRVIETLQRQMIYFLDQSGDEDLAPLMVILARAYQQAGEYVEAQHWFRLAEQKIAKTDSLNSQILVGLAQIELVGIDDGDVDQTQSADLRRALELFSAAESNYPSAKHSYIDALIGTAYCEARLGDHPEAIEHFQRAVSRLLGNPRRQDDKIDHLTTLIMAQHSLNFQREEYDLALNYLGLVLPLYGKVEMPPDLLAKFAESHEAMAQFHRHEAEKLAKIDPSLPGAPTRAARELANRESAIHYNEAAEYYLRHARAVTISDDEAFGISIWQAAVCFSEAQNWSRAIDTFSEFVSSRPTDANYREGIYRLGQAYQADMQYNTARQNYEQLIELYPTTLEAYKSIVPLAQCQVVLENVTEAKRWLNYVIDGLVTTTASGVVVGGGITPDSAVYRDALVELGKLHYKRQEYEDAIRRLTEAVDPSRYGQSESAASLRFYLADSNRMSVEQINRELDGPLTPTERQALNSERAERLEKAQILFTQVISELESRPTDELSPLENLFHRNSYFYRADAAFDLGQYEHSIELYDLAAKRFEHHPSALVAMIQIVNAYCELDEPQKARIANERARWLLNRIPEDKFDDPTLPMTRKHWQDWLRWTSELNLFGDDGPTNLSSAAG